jgi:hypothetical protein
MEETRGGPLGPCRAVKPAEEWLANEVERAAESAAKAILEKRKAAKAAALANAHAALAAAARARAAAFCATGRLFNQTGADHVSVVALHCCPGRCPACGAHACGKLAANGECCGRFKEPCARAQADTCVVPPEGAAAAHAAFEAMARAAAELDRLEPKPKDNKTKAGLLQLPAFLGHHHHGPPSAAKKFEQHEKNAVKAAVQVAVADASNEKDAEDAKAQREAAIGARDATAANREAAAADRAAGRVASRTADRAASSRATAGSPGGGTGRPVGTPGTVAAAGAAVGTRASVLASLQEHKGRGPGAKAAALEAKVRKHGEKAAEKQIEAELAAERAPASLKKRVGGAYRA